ncbi:response regulator [Parafilimonas terrae]|uniref:Two-component system, NtrC family, nitrogen regulation response regulator GlnG n=1 Tax=Parafilimonas terrae TaxID=1465490 RepID=A0A1I5TGP3_9BACT|nr:response regulator [Parafilimonas terrae]SFP82219.1 two-component system, NtrC family, nitrogen regulation response regulator GlnG [Parafilimonas terrae]
MLNTKLPPAQTKKIFIVEDEGDMCLLLNIMLQEKSIELEHVKTIAAAQEYLKKEEPSVIILDNKLPDGLGVDFISYIKQNHPDVKVVMISGYTPEAKDIALENGADLFLEKPFTREQLYSSIKELLN